jgi:hypothetical protein
LYYPPNIISIFKRKMRWVRHIACMGQMRNITLSGRCHLKGATQRWKDNIEVELEGLGCGLYSSGSG